jgi:hypothetical protein
VAEFVTRRFLADVAAGCIIGGYVGKYRDIANGRMVTALVETAMAAGLVQPAAGRGQPALLTDAGWAALRGWAADGGETHA